MISLSSDEVMLVARTFLESSPWLVVTLLEPLSDRQQDTAGGTLKTDSPEVRRLLSNRCNPTKKNCSTLRVVPYVRECFNPTSKDY